MKDMNFNGLDHITADQRLIGSTVNKVMSGSRSHNYFYSKISIATAVSLVMILSTATFYSFHSNESISREIANKAAVDNNANLNKTAPEIAIAPIDTLPNKTVTPTEAVPDETIADNSITSSKSAEAPRVTSDDEIPLTNSGITGGGASKNDMIAMDATSSRGTISKDSASSNDNISKDIASSNDTIIKEAAPSSDVTPGNTVTDINLASNNAVTADKTPSSNTSQNNNGIISAGITSVAKNDAGIYIPQINPNPGKAIQARMVALVVYNGKIYTQSATEIDGKNIKNFIGNKIGHSINSINEWNVKAKSSEELASNIGEQDIYTVRGYDSGFRIMSYLKIEDREYAQFFDCLNGITIKSGSDVFGKLYLVNNVENAKFISFDDWNNGVNTYITFKDTKLLNEALIELNAAVPFNYEAVESEIDSSRNNSGFRQFTLKLKDGSELKLSVFKSGYVSYGYSNIYFKVDASVINKLWQQ
jgi:hypothetical protein